MNAKTTTLALAAALLTLPAAPLAGATHSLCHNGEAFPDEFQVLVILGHEVAVDTGTNNGSYVLCVDSTGLVVDVILVGTGVVTGVRICNGNTAACAVVLGTTGAAVGPGGPGITCTLGTCVYVWINGTQVAP